MKEFSNKRSNNLIFLGNTVVELNLKVGDCAELYVDSTTGEIFLKPYTNEVKHGT